MRFLTGVLVGAFLRPIVWLIAFVVIGVLVLNIHRVDTRPDTDTLVPIDMGTRAVRAIDGDTIVVAFDGHDRRVRLLGIEAPKTTKRGHRPQRCSREASAAASRWIHIHRRITVVGDPGARDHNRHGRLLGYVQPHDGGHDLSYVQAEAGLARVKTYGEDLDETATLQGAEARAQANRVGLWGTGCR